MFILRLVVLLVLTAWSQPSFSKDKTSKDIDWQSRPEFVEVLPIIQQLYTLSNYAPESPDEDEETDLKDAPSKTPGEAITVEMITDYARLIAFARSRPRPFNRPHFKKGMEFTTLINLNSYPEHYYRVPDNITVFHNKSGCTLECRKILFESRAQSYTVANPIAERATRYFKPECEGAETQRFSWDDNFLMRRRKSEILSNPVLGLCIDSEETQMPETGYYFGSTSPLWPREYETGQRGSSKIFPELTHIRVEMTENNHWSVRHSYSQEMNIIFERACFKTTPALPKSATDILDEITSRIMAENKVWERYLISTKDQGFCYYPKWGGNIGKDAAVNFFPKVPGADLKLDLRRVMSSEQYVAKLNNYKFDLADEGDARQVAKRRHIFTRTLIYLSSEHPNYYEEIFPHILPRLFDSSEEGLGKPNYLVQLFHEAKPPIGSLSSQAEAIEILFDEHLVELGCKDWVCPNTKAVEGGQYKFYNMIVGLGQSAYPILTRMEQAGMKKTESLSNCIGGLTAEKKAKYYRDYKDQFSIGAATLRLKDIKLPETKPVSFIAGRFFDSVSEAKARTFFSMSNNLGYATNHRQIYFYDGIHSDIKTYLEEHDLMKKVKFIERQNYDHAKALLTTEHAIEVAQFLQNRLDILQGENPDEADDYELKLTVRHGVTSIIHGMDINELATSRGQRLREISILKDLIEKYNDNSPTCEYRRSKPFVSFP